VEVEGELVNRMKMKRRKAGSSGKSWLPAAKSNIHRGDFVVATVYQEAPCSYPGRSLGLRGKAVTAENERTKQ
jgi:hypothetical protein